MEGWGQAIDEEGMKFESVADEQALQRQAAELVTAYLKQVPQDEPKPVAVEVGSGMAAHRPGDRRKPANPPARHHGSHP